jgi:hypothetical protein
MKLIKLLPALLISANILFANNTSIEWLEEAPTRMSWKDAMQYCKDADAVLPTRAVFKKVWMDHGKSSEIVGFDLSVSFWTIDEVKDNKHAAYPFYFGEGRDTWYYKADHYGVRCIKK